MDKEQFVEEMRRLGISAIGATLESLKDNPPSSPHPGDVRRANWFQSLYQTDRAAVQDVIRTAVQTAIFIVLSELDGVGGAPGTLEQGMYELRYRKGDENELLNDPEQELLHDLYQSLIGEETPEDWAPTTDHRPLPAPTGGAKPSPLRELCSLPELDPALEKHAYLRHFKRERRNHWSATTNPLYDLSGLQTWPLLLGRGNEATTLALAVRPHVSAHNLKAFEILREEVVPLGALGALQDERWEVAQGLLTTWGTSVPGWRSRTRPRDRARSYSVVGTPKDEAFEGIAELHGSAASDRLFTLSRYLVWLFTDHLILDRKLPGTELLEQANVSEVMILDRIAIVRPAVEELLERMRREYEKEK